MQCRQRRVRGWNTAVIIAPIKIAGTDYVCEVVVKKTNNGQKFYLHEVEIKEKLEGVFKSVEKNTATPQASRLILAKHLQEVKPENVSKVVDEYGEPRVVYHGTARADRVGFVFDPARATSGPMAMFTDNKPVAQNYSTGKEDTSIATDSNFASFGSRFKVKTESGRFADLDKAWWSMSADKRREISEKAKHITFDEDGENIVFDEGVSNGTGGFEHNFKRANSNTFKALIFEWLESGNLFRENEVKFADVLKLAGVEDVLFNNPYRKEPKVYEVFLNIQNPFGTGNVSKRDIEGLKAAAKKIKYDPAQATSADAWDKTGISPTEWIAKFEDGLAKNSTWAWTSIPDWVTNYLKAQGYDGIKDTGGKGGGAGHTVWIPFESTQIKSATDNIGTFDEKNPDIRFSTGAIRNISADEVEAAISEADEDVSKLALNAESKSQTVANKALKAFIEKHLDSYEEADMDEDYLAEYGRVWDSQYGDSIRQHNGSSEFFTEDEYERQSGTFKTLDDAKRSAIADYWRKNEYNEYDFKELETWNVDEAVNQNRRKFEAALKKLGLNVKDSQRASTGSEYLYLKMPNGEEMKVRFADHEKKYAADISVENDWKAAVRFVAERFNNNDWDEEHFEDIGDQGIRFSAVDMKGVVESKDLPSDMPTNINADDFLRNFKEWAIKRYSNSHVKMADEKGVIHDVSIDARGIKESLNHLRKRISEDKKKLYLKTMPVIEELLGNSKFKDKPENKHGEKLDVYKYEAKFADDGILYGVNITIKENRQGKFYYDHNLTKIETLGVLKNSETNNASTSSVYEESSANSLESQDGNHENDMRFLYEQDKDSNPISYASMQIAKYMIAGMPLHQRRNITNTRLEKYLPSPKYTDFHRQEALDMAQRIATKIENSKEKYVEELQLNAQIKRIQNDIYFEDVVNRISDEFTKTGEWFGEVLTKAKERLKREKERELKNIEGYTAYGLGLDLVEAIINAKEAEPERMAKTQAVQNYDDAIDDEIEGEGLNVDSRDKAVPQPIADIIKNIKKEILRREKKLKTDDKTQNEIYRKSLVNILREAANELSYGKEREAIFAKISELVQKNYAVITITDGERSGQKIDNFTLRAENIAMRIFRRGVRDAKQTLNKRLEAALKSVGKFKPTEREDKRKQAGKVQARIKRIKDILYMPHTSKDETQKSVDSEIERTTNIINTAMDKDISGAGFESESANKD